MIQVNALSFAYPGSEGLTLKALDFEIKNGEIFGFLGPSGAGKSTTQKILIGILKKYQGEILIKGKDLRQWGPEFYETLGVAFETPNLYSRFSAIENLNFFRQFYSGSRRDPMELLESVGLKEAARTRVSDFSKGMKVRLNFCRSLLNQPELLFLDEPSAGLDPVNQRKMIALIRQERDRGATICLSTHDMHVADALCDRVAFIVEGEIPLVDSPRELKLRYGERNVALEYQQKEERIRRVFPMEGLAANPEFQSLLATNDIETIHSQEASLEDVFVKTTGRKLI